ncbi:MAG: CRTAC1 family protein, partial [Gemmatimonadetes bacterium]|nr:CRTAC1 family protein [Gemmatimonadota bacterium]
GGGAALLAADGDGDLDIYWVNGEGGNNAFYRNDRDRGFVDRAAAAGATGRGWGMGSLSAVYDADGDADLYITCLQENILYRNDGLRPELSRRLEQFADATARAGLALPVWSTGAAMGDADLDGDLDLYVANYADFDSTAVRPLGTQWKGRDVFIGPLGLPALPDALYRNDGAGTFAEVGLQANAALGETGLAQAGMGAAWGDYDNDSDGDLLVTNFEDDYNTLYRNIGDGTFADVSFAAGLGRISLPFVGFGAVFVDFDNDADQDLFVANGHVYPQIERPGSGATYAQANHLFANEAGHFSLVELGEDRAVSRGAVAGDFDDDGRVDLFVTNLNGRPSLLHNQTAVDHHWLGLRLVGAGKNREAVGAKVVLWSGGQRQRRDVLCGESFLGSGDRRVHFGLGAAGRADSLHIYWPSGALQRLIDLPIDAYMRIEEGG